MTTAERLVDRLRREFPELGIPEGSVATRTYAPASGRNLGAWSWYLRGPDGVELRVGSRHTMTSIVRADALVLGVENELSVHKETVVNVQGDEW